MRSPAIAPRALSRVPPQEFVRGEPVPPIPPAPRRVRAGGQVLPSLEPWRPIAVGEAFALVRNGYAADGSAVGEYSRSPAGNVRTFRPRSVAERVCAFLNQHGELF